MRALLLLLLLLAFPARAGLPPLDPRVPKAFHLSARPPTRVTLAAPVEVPLLPAARPNVLVTLNGKGPYRFGIETGAPGVVVSPELAAALALPDAGGDDVLRAHRIDRIAIGEAVFEGVVAAASELGSPDVDGLLGLAFFHDVLLTVDGPGRRARLERGALPAPDGKGVVAFERIGPFVAVPVRFGAKTHLAIVDTRAASELSVMPGQEQALRLAGPPAEVGRVRGPGIPETPLLSARLEGAATFAGVTVEGPILSIHAVAPPIPAVPLVGNGVLSKLTFTLDQRRGRIRFAAPGPIPPPPPIRALGVGLRPRPGAPPVVGPVAPGSAAERAGVREGDVLVSLAGVPASELDPGKARALLGSAGSVKLVLARDGAEREVELEPVTLVR